MTPRAGLRLAHLAVGLAAVAALVLLTTTHLEDQGPQYDELHQAVPAFTWLGSTPGMFCAASVGRLCVLNMTYSGAIKTNLYGAYLRLGAHHFTLRSWRLVGIVAVAAAIVLFCVIAAPALPPWALAVVLALVLTDINLLLNVRFDGGPVALSLLGRLSLIALWLRQDARGRIPSPRNSFVLGAITGLLVFEKLSSVVLIAGLAAAWWLGNPGRRTWRHLRAMTAGLAVGVAPLVAINLYMFVTRGVWISLRDVGPSSQPSPAWPAQLGRYLALGQGSRVKEWILDLHTSRWLTAAEAVLVVASGLTIVVVAWRARSSSRPRLAGALIATYAAIGVGLLFMPRRVSFHHHILGTPYHYVALALVLVALVENDGLIRRGRALRLGLAGLVACWIGLRLIGLVPVEIRLASGGTSLAWDPSLREFGTFAAAHQDEATFVASDWGVGTQPYCFIDGRRGVVYEPFWHYGGVGQIHEFQRRSGRRVIYLVRLRQPAKVLEATGRIEHDLAADPALREVEAEPEARALRAVLVRKFVYEPALTPG